MFIKKYISSFSSAFLMTSLLANAQQTQVLNLKQATELALQNNHLLKIQKEKVSESREKITESKSKGKPLVYATGNYIFNGVTKDLSIPKGSFGNLAGNPLPQADVPLFQGKHNLLLGNVLAYQPVSQLKKIGIGVKVAETDVSIAQTQVTKSELDIRLGVEKLYLGILITQKQLEETKASLELTEMKLYDVESALIAGKTELVNKVGLQADLSSQQQKLLQLTNQIEDYSADLKELTGFRSEETLVLANPEETLPPLQSLETYLLQAKNSNPEIQLVNHTIQKANYGVQAAQSDHIPSIGLMGGYTYQNVISDLPANNYFVGLNVSWNIFDFGKRKSELNQRISQKKQGEEYLEYMQENIRTKIEKAYRKVNQSQQLIAVAKKVVSYRKEEFKLKSDKKDSGLNLKRDLLETKASLAKAESDLFAAQLNYRLTLSELQSLTGIL
ncbi:Outer membrane protein TolC [Pseudarcicella hirudinis]|uniref:Outer membrane protein TolC n=1 Tax=Pseudarcicella hirudinis TaxID=1079859 RepID=A0A1I5QGG2_9BACT|nr:TolC family protein [Pseudarcicella hirudinis]SFP45399.1 Outer membrane protein TolC [Pseudarcicella hirudinis]